MGHNRAGDIRKKKQRNRAKIARLKAEKFDREHPCLLPRAPKEFDKVKFDDIINHAELGMIKPVLKDDRHHNYFCLVVEFKENIGNHVTYQWLSPKTLSEAI